MPRRIDAEILPKVPTAGESVIPQAPLVVRSYSWKARGGPDTAQLDMTGDPMRTWDALNWLRCPVILRDDNGTPVWWGFVESVEVGVGAITIGARLDTLANRVAVAYTERGGAGIARGTTPWAEDSYSTAIFGTRELLLSQSDLNAQTATAYRDAQLAIRKVPQATVDKAYGPKTTARILCRGWYSTIGWKYFSRSQGRYAYLPATGTGTTSFAFGVPAVPDPDPAKAKPAYLKLAQQFVPSSGGWDVSTINLQIRKVGNPTEGVRVSIWSHNSGLGIPLAELRNTTVPDSAIGGSGGDWVTFILGSPWPADPAGLYWLIVERNGGSPNKDNYYTIQGANVIVNPPGYPQYWDGTAWTPFVGTLAFILEGVEETHLQMGAILDAAQFIEGYRVTDNFITTVGSGVFSNPYRSGDTNALTELESLMDVGNAGGFRYVANLDVNGFLIVYPEPAQGQYNQDWTIDAQGGLVDHMGVPVDPSRCPVGRWVSLSGILPKPTNIQALSIPQTFYIEASTYNAVTGTLDLTPRGDAGLEDIGRVRQG